MYHAFITPTSTPLRVLRGSAIGMLLRERGLSSEAVVVDLSVQALSPSEIMTTPIQSSAVPKVASIVAGRCAVCPCWAPLGENHS